MKKGFRHSEETRKKISDLLKGKVHSGSFKKGHIVTKEVKLKISQANKGKTPWNKNKKLPSHEVSEETRDKIRKALMNNKNGEGNKNRVFSKETRMKMSNSRIGKKLSLESCKKMSNSKIGIMPKNLDKNGTFMNIKRGWFDIGGKQMFFRSTWEANYALYLNWLKKIGEIKDWDYETDVFIFHKIQFGTRSYRPDFKIFNKNDTIHYDEVKGYMDSKSITKIKRMKKYYPEITLNIIERKDYTSIKQKVGKMLHFF